MPRRKSAQRIAEDAAGIRTCKTCEAIKPLEDFPGAGKQGRGIYCKRCHTTQQQARARQNRAAGRCVTCSKPAEEGTSRCTRCRTRYNENAVDVRRDLKRQAVDYLGGHCLDCGLISEIAEVYDFHHRDPAIKESAVAYFIAERRPWDKLRQELDKCDLLCANCHRIRHALANRGLPLNVISA